MKKIEGYELVNEAGEFKSLPAGAYAVRITAVVDKPDSEYLEVYVDIAEGEFKGYFKTLADANNGKDYSRSCRSYKTNALPFFKAFITAIEKSNPGYQWNWDEKTLVGKFCAVEFGEEEYVKDDEVRTSVKAVNFRSLQALREGKCKTPEKKCLSDEEKAKLVKPSESSVLKELSDSELPF